jgi:uncharacterized protein YecE (DUF72 family)
MEHIKFGTCSWKYDSWQGIVYTEHAKANYLQEYSQKFNTVEIDQWFWSLFSINKVALPLPHVVREYHDSVPKNFKFTIKVPNSITLTHFYRKSKTDSLNINPHFLSNDLFEQFLTSLEPMHNKIGVLMFQFEYLNKQKMPSLERFLESFAQFISKCDLNFTYALEIRNPNYLNHGYFQFLKEKNIGHVFLQGYYLPSIIEVYQKFKSSLVSPVVIRLHGPDRSDIEAKSKGIWDQILESRDEEIAKITQIIEQMQEKNLEVYVNVNNHYEGSAPLTIERIRSRLNLK